MKFFQFLLILIFYPVFGQNISVQTNFTPQELIEDILMDSGCISNVNVTDAVSGNFSGGDLSYGYFTNNNSSFPFANGVVMSTGRLSNVPGPNTSLSDDDAPNWGGDNDLEQVLNVQGTVNASIIEFDFTPNANQIQFNYIFASEEYQENDPNTCRYSDVFAFLIKPQGGTYTNIAVVPGTNTPVQVTTVHPAIPGGCEAENEAYFDRFNPANAPINFNGQTKTLTATADVIPNTSYHIKLIIADEKNYRYDSAVFLEGGSFNIGANLGEDLVGENGLCPGEVYSLSSQNTANTPQTYSWYAVQENAPDILLASGPNETNYPVNQAGRYKLVLDYGNACIAEDEIEVEYIDFKEINNQTLLACDTDDDGLSIFNLESSIGFITNNNALYKVQAFYTSRLNAENKSNPITTTTNFENTLKNQVIFARVETARGCYHICELRLETTENPKTKINLINCPDTEGSVKYNLVDATTQIESMFNAPGKRINYYQTAEDALKGENSLPINIQFNAEELPLILFAKIENATTCIGIIEVELLAPPQPNIKSYEEKVLCDAVGEITLMTRLQPSNAYQFLWSTGETTPQIKIQEIGEYWVEVSQTTNIRGENYTCKKIKEFKVKPSSLPQLSYQLLPPFGSGRIAIKASGTGSYAFAVDQNQDFSPQSAYTLSLGEHTIYARDLYGCGTASIKVNIPGFMAFFTPNQDGFNDVWRLQGISRQDPNIEYVLIYDRYGKLIHQMNPYQYWDGNYNGKLMPSNDYWFVIQFKNSRSFKGHLTLKR